MRNYINLESFSVRKNSGGRGKYNGGNGVVRKVRFLEEMNAGILSGNRLNTPFGLHGGTSGKAGKSYFIKKDGTVKQLHSTATEKMLSGDTFVIETPGGGGFGKDTNLDKDRNI